MQHDLKVGLLSVGHAKAILAVEDPEVQNQLCDLVLRDGLSVRQLEALVRKIQLTPTALPKVQPAVPELPQDWQSLTGALGKFASGDVSVKRSASGKGSVTIRFSSDGEVHDFLEALNGIS